MASTMTGSALSMGPADVKESVIRKMTRLAAKYNAVNLSQGFPNEPPPLKVRLALAQAVLSGTVESDDEAMRLSRCKEHDLAESLVNYLTSQGHISFSTPSPPFTTDVTSADDGESKTDELNQYSPPMGRADARRAISDHYQRLYGYSFSSDHVTLTLGATEAVATALRTVGRPGDKVVIFEPFHELYPSQCGIFYLDPVFVTLRPSASDGKWEFEVDELKDALKGARAMIMNSPHNPTGKVFDIKEMKSIVDLCLENDVYIITDEIYEHMCYPDSEGNPRQHIVIPNTFPEARDRTLVCNSISKSASATGWRLGWCLTPPHLTESYRGIHDQMVAMAPHPMQYASLAYFTLSDGYFREELPERYKDRSNMLARILHEVGFKVNAIEGSYYLFVDYRGVKELEGMEPMNAAMHLMTEVGVACVPGDNFYGKSKDGNHYLRFAACRSMSDIVEACGRLKQMPPL